MTSVYDSQQSLHSQLDEKEAQSTMAHSQATALGLGAPISVAGGEDEVDVNEGPLGGGDTDLDGREEQRGLLEARDDALGGKSEEKVTYVAAIPPPLPTGPRVNLRILVISGQTHVFTFEPEHSVARVKEIIWHSWPKGWSKDPSQPPGPGYCRLLYLGRVLADDATLTSLNLRLAPAVTIIHLSVRTFELEEEPPKKSILPFSLRPSPMTRSNSSQNATQLIPLSVTNAANGIAPGTGASLEDTAGRPALGSRLGSARDRARTAAAPTTATAPASAAPMARNAAIAATTTSRSAATYDTGNDSHGGGCKCVIM